MEVGMGAMGEIREMSSERYQRHQLDVERIRQHLRTQLFGLDARLQYIPIIDSTNTLAMKLAREGIAGEGTVVITDSQTAGKGRLGRRWIDAFGYNVLSSTILWPHFPLYLLVMFASLAVVDTIDDLFENNRVNMPQAAIKWPNDVLISERKVAGILVETSHDRSGRLFAVLGIGVNVHELPASSTDDATSSLLERATTLETAYGHAVSREAFLARLVEHLEASYLALEQETGHHADRTDLVGQPNPNHLIHRTDQLEVEPHTPSASRLIRERWRGRLSTVGRAVQVRQGKTLIEGFAEDVDESGELLLRRHSGERVTITWGDIGYPTGDLMNNLTE